METGERKYEAIYYPDCYPKSINAFAAAALYFDHVNFVTPSMMTSGYEKHTEFLKKITKDDFQIYAMLGNNKRDRNKYGTQERTVSRIVEYYEFVSRIRSLLGDVVFYHPNLLEQASKRITSKILYGEGVLIEDLFRHMNGETDEQIAIREFVKSNPNLNDGILELVLPTARHLALSNDWIAISDIDSLPTPIVKNAKSSAHYLAAQLALEVLEVTVPKANFTDADDILEVRDHLKGELHAFRIMMLQMAADLRSLIADQTDYSSIRREAKFLVDTKLEPIMQEVKSRIELEKSQLWRKIFGKVVKYIPLVVGSFSDPTKICLTKTIQEAVSDTSELFQQTEKLETIRSTGISYLIKIEQQGT